MSRGINRQIRNDTRALFLVMNSAVLGVLYFSYLNAEPFPPDIARLVPIAWLAGAVLGGVLAVRAFRSNRSTVAVLALVLNVPNLLLAAVFSLAALMGD